MVGERDTEPNIGTRVALLLRPTLVIANGDMVPVIYCILYVVLYYIHQQTTDCIFIALCHHITTLIVDGATCHLSRSMTIVFVHHMMQHDNHHGYMPFVPRYD